MSWTDRNLIDKNGVLKMCMISFISYLYRINCQKFNYCQLKAKINFKSKYISLYGQNKSLSSTKYNYCYHEQKQFTVKINVYQ